ncbi:MAG: FHA domain-containing protein [Caldiserica bacterium]|nr:FHA domain-containing protein [Caldisericota bacterium]
MSRGRKLLPVTIRRGSQEAELVLAGGVRRVLRALPCWLDLGENGDVAIGECHAGSSIVELLGIDDQIGIVSLSRTVAMRLDGKAFGPMNVSGLAGSAVVSWKTHSFSVVPTIRSRRRMLPQRRRPPHIVCPSCGETYEAGAKQCPTCGFPWMPAKPKPSRTPVVAAEVMAEQESQGTEDRTRVFAFCPAVTGKLVCTTRSGVVQESVFSLGGEPLSVGRSRMADITLAGLQDASMSRFHFRLDRRGSDVYITDSSSTNGTLLNGKEVKEDRLLRTGDVIEAGSTAMKVVIGGGRL